ncbi:MAG: non-canonical purine NTP pyrophosphatase [Pedobacter sp.]|nr:MAG: non-canonical purine NTP pyrophosphatase [Pedobacter sp.]
MIWVLTLKSPKQGNGYTITLAEMDMAQKNQISHRAIAMKKLMDFLAASA